MGRFLRGGGLSSPMTRPHVGGLEGGARLVSVIVGILLLGAGLLHISAAADHTNLPLMMVGFLIVAALQAGLGGLLLFRRPGRLVVAGGVMLLVAALGTWLLSRTAGLPFLPGGHMEPIGFKDGVTVLFEVSALPLLALLASRDLDRVRLPSPRLGSRAVSLVGAGMFVLFVPAFMLGGGEHHSAAELAAGHAHAGESMGADGDHAHDGELLAEGPGGHLEGSSHDGGSQTGHADGEHDADADEDGDHAHGRPAGELFADAHAGDSGHSDEAGQHAADGGHGLITDRSAMAGKGGTGHGSAHASHGGNGGGDHGSGHRKGGGRHSGSNGGGSHGDGNGGGGHGGEDREGHGGHGDDDHDDAGNAGTAPGSGERSIALESGHEGGDGKRPRGPAVVLHDQPDERTNGRGHAHADACEPTAAQQAAADAIVRDVRAELRQYENNPAAALADGFDYVFGPTDRMIHVVHLGRVNDPDVVKPSEIESFVYYMTDTGWVPIAGMFIMPEYGASGPEPGGCLTQWHHHGGIIGRWATAGTSANTPEMMHVFTYPGLDPWGHYNGRDLASLWTPGRWVPSVCRTSGDANDGCLP